MSATSMEVNGLLTQLGKVNLSGLDPDATAACQIEIAHARATGAQALAIDRHAAALEQVAAALRGRA